LWLCEGSYADVESRSRAYYTKTETRRQFNQFHNADFAEHEIEHTGMIAHVEALEDLQLEDGGLQNIFSNA